MRTAALSLIALSLILAGASSAGTVLLQDDFNAYGRGSDGYPLWTADSGQWKVTDDGFVGSDCDGSFAAMGARTGRAAWADYSLSLRLKIISRGSDWRDGPWIGFRYQDSGNAYTLGFYDRVAALHKASKGKATEDANPLAQSPATIKDDQWHEVKVSVVGRTIAVALDGKAILEATDEGWNGSPPVASGGIVLAARKYEKSEGRTQAAFRDVRVEAVGDVPQALAFTLDDARKAAVRRSKNVSLLEFLKSRRDRRWVRVPRKVLAFYYTWYGRPERHGHWLHWDDVRPDQHQIATSTHYPTKGAYDSLDPALIDGHIDLAKGCGIDAFIATWWAQGDVHDQAFALLLDHAATKGFEATVYWETVPGKGRARIARAVSDLVYVLERYGSHPAFLKVDEGERGPRITRIDANQTPATRNSEPATRNPKGGKPVLFVYGRVMGEVGLAEWPEIISLARERYGKDFLLIADGYREDYARVFDGVHTYNPCGWVAGKKPDELAAFSRKAFAGAVEMAKSNAKLSCITVIPGYDDTKIRKPGLDAQRQGGETYRVLWEQAIAADPDWVVITSWNEWHEGSEIEPSWEDGDKYVKMTAGFARQFKSTPYSKAPVPVAPAGVSPEAAEAMRQLFKGKTIGVLPDFGGKAVFWLVDAGVALRELAWRDLLDPALFNARDLPVVVYAGFEEYVQNVKDKGDVDQAILRYLGEGGLLMVLPTGPFPFYYNEEKEPVASAGKLGLPLCGSGAAGRHDIAPGSPLRGWEKPPDGVRLTFKLDRERLPGLPAAVPFPDSGDLRWRPCVGSVLAEGDAYLPLARLVDEQGRDYGDGIAFIEHKASAPRNGKLICAWMRMADVLDADKLFCALFRLAAEKTAK